MKKSLLSLICCFSLILPVMSQTIDPRLEVVATFGESQPIGVSVSSDNRVFVSFPKRQPYVYGLTEIVAGERKPFPDTAWNAVEGKEEEHFVNVQDIYVDTNDQLWVLDSKPASSGSIFGSSDKGPKAGQFKMVQIDLGTNQVKRVYTFDDLDKTKSGLNDVRIDTEKGLAYFSDPGQAAIIVMDLKSGRSRKALANSEFTLADSTIVLQFDGEDMVDHHDKPFSSNVNGIALTKDNKWFYFKPINAKKLYRIATEYLADPKLTDAELAKHVEDMGEVGITHGLAADKENNIYLTTSLDYTVRRLKPDGKIEILAQDSRILWPDSMGVGSDGYLYFSCAQMHLLPHWNYGANKLIFPFGVYRVKVL